MKTKHETRISQSQSGVLSNQALRTNKVKSRRGDSTKQARTICNKTKSGYNGITIVDSESHQQHGDVTMSNNTDARLDMMQVQVDSTEKVVNAGLSGYKAEIEGHKLHADGRFEAMLAQMDADRREAAANNKANQERIDTKHEAIQERMDADRRESDAKHEAMIERMDAKHEAMNERIDADRREADAKHEAMIERMDAKHEAMNERIDAKHEAIQERMDADRREADAKHEAMNERIDGNQRVLEDKIEASAISIKLWVIITLISSLAGGAGLVAAGISIVNGLSGG